MKNISRRKDGRYCYRKQITGQIITIYAKTKESLKEKIKELNLIKTYKRKPKSNKTLISWMNNWYEKYKKNFVSKSTKASIQTVINKLSSSKIAQADIKQITTEDLQTYLNKIPRSRTKELMCLYINACFKKAQQLKIIESNPFENVNKDKKIKSIRTAFSFDEQKTIFEEIQKTQFFAPIFVYLFCGVRRNELPKDIGKSIQEDNTLKIENEKKRDGTTTYRYIEITDRLKEVLLNNKNQFISPNRIFKKFKEFLKEFNIEGNLHKLRHTFTTNHLYLGTPDKFIQNWLGHEDISTTKNNYMNIDRSLSKEKLIKLYGDYYYIINP